MSLTLVPVGCGCLLRGGRPCPCWMSVVSHARSDEERLRFMRGLQDVWRVHGRHVMAAFDLSPFPLVCDLGGECVLRVSQQRFPLRVGGV